MFDLREKIIVLREQAASTESTVATTAMIAAADSFELVLLGGSSWHKPNLSRPSSCRLLAVVCPRVKAHWVTWRGRVEYITPQQEVDWKPTCGFCDSRLEVVGFLPAAGGNATFRCSWFRPAVL